MHRQCHEAEDRDVVKKHVLFYGYKWPRFFNLIVLLGALFTNCCGSASVRFPIAPSSADTHGKMQR